MSYLVEQSPYCDLLKLSLTTRRFVCFGQAHLRWSCRGGFLHSFFSVRLPANARERDRVGSSRSGVYFFSTEREANAQERDRVRSFPRSGVYFFSLNDEANAQVRDRVRSSLCGMYFISH